MNVCVCISIHFRCDIRPVTVTQWPLYYSINKLEWLSVSFKNSTNGKEWKISPDAIQLITPSTA